MLSQLKVYTLGAGQDVGRSCIILEYANKRVMLDCGVHLLSPQKFPDFSLLPSKDLTSFIDCALISHFHLDHCGALPVLTEVAGYKGPIIMSYPTRAIVPLLLEDFRKVGIDPKVDPPFTFDMIAKCFQNVKMIQLHETMHVNGITLKAYYAGHVLGATIFFISWNGLRVVYTGDFNTVGDRHLGAAFIDNVKPHLMLTETTYGTTVRESKRMREREFLKQVSITIKRGGKVLIPVFALGRSQELCILLETYWSRGNFDARIYFAGGLTEKANLFYKLFIGWTNEKIKKIFLKQNMFDFKHIQPFDKALIYSPSPMVLFATPGMLHGGLSLAVFKEWCTNEKNALIIPGYCSPGTVGHKLLNGVKKLEIDNAWVQVKCEILNMSFSAHADAKGILQLMTHLQPEQIILLHGEKETMRTFSNKVSDTLRIPVHMPENNLHIALNVNINGEILVAQTMMQIIQESDCLIKNLGLGYSEVTPLVKIQVTEGEKGYVGKEFPVRKSALLSSTYKTSVVNIHETLSRFKESVLKAAELDCDVSQFEKHTGVETKIITESEIQFLWMSEDNEIGEWVADYWHKFTLK